MFSIYICDEFKNQSSMKLLCEVSKSKLKQTLIDLILSDIGEVRTLDIYTGTPSTNKIVKLSEEETKGKIIDKVKLTDFIENSSINKLNTFVKYLYIKPKFYI